MQQCYRFYISCFIEARANGIAGLSAHRRPETVDRMRVEEELDFSVDTELNDLLTARKRAASRLKAGT